MNEHSRHLENGAAWAVVSTYFSWTKDEGTWDLWLLTLPRSTPVIPTTQFPPVSRSEHAGASGRWGLGEALDFKTLEKMGQVVVEKVALEMRTLSMLMQNGWGVGRLHVPGAVVQCSPSWDPWRMDHSGRISRF